MSTDALDWLKLKTLQKVLRHSEGDESLEVQNIVKVPAVEKGINFGSDLVRAVVEYCRNKSGVKVIESKSLIIKMSPISEGFQKELITDFGAFDTEIRMMDGTLPKLNDILSEKGYRFNPDVLYTETGDPSLIVMEDLAKVGYRMATCRNGLDLEHSILVMRGLAKFHATSVALFEKDPTSMTAYNRGIFHEDNPVHVEKYFSEEIRKLGHEVLNWSELGSSARSYSEKLLKLSKVCYERATECCKPKENDFNVLNHGDIWVNNMLFSYNDEDKVTDHIFIDFQVCVWSTPAVDITRFINGNTSEDVDLHHRGALLEEYLNVLTKTMSRLKCKTKQPSMATLEKILMEREIMSIIWTISGLRVLLIDKKDEITFDKLMHHGDDQVDSTFKGVDYRRRIIGRLVDWNARGLLDD